MVQDALNRISTTASMAVSIADLSKAVMSLQRGRLISQAWKLGNGPRGNRIESLLAFTRYAGHEWVGKLNNGFFKTLDFFKNGLGTQLKSFSGKSVNFSTYKKTIDNLKKSVGTTIEGRTIEAVHLDVAVQKQSQIKLFEKVQEYAKKEGVSIDVFVAK